VFPPNEGGNRGLYISRYDSVNIFKHNSMIVTVQSNADLPLTRIINGGRGLTN